jgi:hypothetical protein
MKPREVSVTETAAKTEQTAKQSSRIKCHKLGVDYCK